MTPEYECNGDIIKAVAVVVKERHAYDNSGHDWQHIFRVWRTAIKLAQLENAGRSIVELASLLHDIDDRKITGNIATERELPNARLILSEVGIGAALVETVCETISMVGFHKSLGGKSPETIEARIVADADQLDAMGAVGIARTFVYGASVKRSLFDPQSHPMQDYTAAQYDANRGSTVNHFFEKLLTLRERMHTEAGAVEAERRHSTMVRFLDDFFAESAAPGEWTERLNRYRPSPIAEVRN
jgi:uncharacterized protein